MVYIHVREGWLINHDAPRALAISACYAISLATFPISNLEEVY